MKTLIKAIAIVTILIIAYNEAHSANIILEKSYDFNSDSCQVGDVKHIVNNKNSFYYAVNLSKGEKEEDGLDYIYPSLVKVNRKGELIWRYSKRFANKVVCRKINLQSDGNIILECLWIRVFGFSANIDFRPLNILLDSNGKELGINIDSNTVLPMRFWYEGGWTDDGKYYVNFTTNVAKLKATHYITKWDKITCQFVEQSIIDSTEFNYLNLGYSTITKAFPTNKTSILISNRDENYSNNTKENLLVSLNNNNKVTKSDVLYSQTAANSEITANIATYYSEKNSNFYFFQIVMDSSNTNTKKYTLNIFNEVSKENSKPTLPIIWNTNQMRVNNHKDNFIFYTYDTVKSEIKGQISDLNINFLDSFAISADKRYTSTNSFVDDINGSEILVCNTVNKIPNIIELRLYNSIPTSVENEIPNSDISQSTVIQLFDILGRQISTYDNYEKLKAEIQNYPPPHLIKWKDAGGVLHFEKMK